MDDGFEITRLALEAACHFNIYCREPLEIIDVTASENELTKERFMTIKKPKGVGDLIAVAKSDVKSSVRKRRSKIELNGKSH
jgi:hypothetical protein